ncbi:Zinc finger CCCH domain-containing protein 34 [Raphanus sativus]|nr:Zinc finger CCCH domain-containing protein 34 [Raphanus sativus]
MERYGRAGEEGSRSDPSIQWTSHGVEASMTRLVLSGGGAGGGGESYPERSDEPDCIYYLRTGVCGYGSRCRFNHPRDRGAVIGGVRGGGGGDGALPERMGHPVCQHFMRTGTCQFGASCKYHHPRQGGGSIAPVSLSYLGYPLRPGEKECSYYMRTAAAAAQPQMHSVYPTLQSQSMPSSPQQYGLVLSRPSLLPGSYLPSHYGSPPPPMVMPPGMVTYPSWNPYQASITAMPSPGTQPSIGSSSVYGMASLSPPGTAYTRAYQSGGPSSLTTSTEQQSFPQRPDQPECQYFMRTGNCKFGSSCRYHHPLDAAQPKTGVVLSSSGLPLLPGVAQCTHFAQHGICKFGPACKFDHSMSSSLSYSPSASSLTEIPVAPYPIGSSSLSGASAQVSSSNEPTTEAVTAVVSPPTVVSGLSLEKPADTSVDSSSVNSSIEAKTSSN